MTAFDHPVLSAWVDDAETGMRMGWDAELAAMLRFEIALAATQSEMGLIPADAADALRRDLDGFRPDMDGLRRGTARDGVVVPALIAQMREATGAAGRHLHHGATSQDVIDTALMLCLADLLPRFAERLGDLEDRLAALSDRWGDRPLMAVTRMRDALPITVADRIAAWSSGVRVAREQVSRVRAEDMAVQLAGPVGTLGRFGDDGPPLRAALAARLDLRDPGGAWHTERGRLCRVGSALSVCCAALGKIGADIGSMAQDGTDAVQLDGGASSSMAHKVNPVDAELLIALALHAAAQNGVLGAAALHGSERSGPAWTLEWLALPPLVRTTGGALRATERLLAAIRRMGPRAPD
ncbi:lyase family protein [Jannaschia sp. LMIT008]|uniref:lyase family protein n=1 Tax=Jannaschia maritima TaxID=3032585 RepID=UPI002811A657|nr:lyase family protein [Jannaschia sp. LMIT008]